MAEYKNAHTCSCTINNLLCLIESKNISIHISDNVVNSVDSSSAHCAHRAFLGVSTRRDDKAACKRTFDRFSRRYTVLRISRRRRSSTLPSKNVRCEDKLFQFYCSSGPAINVTTSDRQRVIIHFFVWNKQKSRRPLSHHRLCKPLFAYLHLPRTSLQSSPVD